ncbi:MAG: formylmethanofuran dehydrogenase [Syntrophomonadaceae bacterium]|mgnify:FL=1|nr:formylmethanofuran dehydrogenase [Syntrophomonadaceae bacterium]
MNRLDWLKAVEFHGHECPGLAIGFRAVEAAREQMGITFSADEEVVCVVENDACGVDAVQVLTGCSLGKGNLIYRDRGKMAFSFFNRRNGDALRLIAKPLSSEMGREERQEYILNAPIDKLFDFMKPAYSLPEMARIFNSVICDSCGENTAEHKMRLQDGKKVCLDCFKDYSRGW